MLVLGIETTCDETSLALVEKGTRILSQVTASSIDLHQPYGGVFPELACRRHSEVIAPLLEEVLRQAGVKVPDLIAVAKGPGLIGALLIGLQFAKGLSIAWKRPLIGVNHVEAHLYAAMMGGEPPFPSLGVVASGGHTFTVQIRGLGDYELIGTTVDDAIGEALDKGATLLGLPYPGGPEIERLARGARRGAFPFKGGKVKGAPLHFSFSGLKTSLLYAVQKLPSPLSDEVKGDLAASFQEAALGDLVQKSWLASQTFPCRAVVVGGGVSANGRLKELLEEAFGELPLYLPGAGLSGDNGAMIGGLGYHLFLREGKGDSLALEAETRIPLIKKPCLPYS